MTVTVRGQKREGSGRVRKSKDTLLFEETYSFSVYTDDLATTRLQVLSASGIPVIGQTLSAGGRAVCISLSAERNPANAYEWNVTAEFSSEVEEDSSGSDAGQGTNPTDWIPIAEMSFETYQFYRQFDINKKPYVNSAGFPFSGGIPETKTIAKFDFDQFEASTLKLEDIIDRNETVNLGSFLGKPQMTWKLSITNAKLGFYYGYKCWRISYSLAYNPETWIVEICDKGPYFWQAGKKIPFSTVAPQQNHVGLLNGQGGPAPQNTPSYITFEQNRKLRFSDFIKLKTGDV